MAGVILYSVEHLTRMDSTGMAKHFEGIQRSTCGLGDRTKWRGLVWIRIDHHLVLMAGQNLDETNAPRSNGRIYALVLERTIDLANAPTKLAFCCYIKSSSDKFYHIYDKTDDVRGT